MLVAKKKIQRKKRVIIDEFFSVPVKKNSRRKIASPLVSLPRSHLVMIDIYPVRNRGTLRATTTSNETKNSKILGHIMRGMAVMLIMSLNASGLNAVGVTAANYFDTETSIDNTYIAGKVDFTLVSTPYTPAEAAINMMTGTTTTKMIQVVPEPNSNPFWYHASSTSFGIDLDFCQSLSLNSSLEGTGNYSGPLTDFLSSATTTLDDWKFDISTNVNLYNKVCTFNFDFNAWQERHNLPSFDEMGFNDTETDTNRIASKGFRLNKVYYDVADGSDEPPQTQCLAKSKGYWANNEGCSGGAGSANWNDEVNALSATYSNLFSATSGGDMCTSLWVPNCPSGDTKAAKLCRAKAHTLADEMNVVSGKLDVNAIISGADDGSSSFDHLGLTSLSTVNTALAVIEAILTNPSSTKTKIDDARHVAERISIFYETENPNTPYCIYSEPESVSISRGAEGDNEWVEVYNQTDTALDISGWEICDNTSCDVIPVASPIPSLGYGLITPSSTTAAFWNIPATMPIIILSDGTIGNGLNNDNDMLILKRPDGVIVDQMNYGPTPDLGWVNYNSDVWNPGATDVAEGNTLARNPSGYDTDQPSDWVELGPPTVNLIHPTTSASETWYWGETQDIEWSATNPNGPDSELLVDLYFIKDIDGTKTITPPDTIEPIVLGTPNDGHYSFTVPTGFVGFIWIKIVVTGPENPMLNDMMVSHKIWDPAPPTLTAEEVVAEIAEAEEELTQAETVGEDTLDETVLTEIVGDAIEQSFIVEITEEAETSAATEENIENQITETAPVVEEEAVIETQSGEETTETTTPEETVEVVTVEVAGDSSESGSTTPNVESAGEETVSEEVAGENPDGNLFRREEDSILEISIAGDDGSGGGDAEPEISSTIEETQAPVVEVTP